MCWKRVELKLQEFLYFGRAEPVARGQHVARKTVLHCLGKHFTWKPLLTLSLPKPRKNAEEILKKF